MALLNKWIILLTTCMLMLGLFSMLPATLTNPTTGNVILIVALVIFIVLGFYQFYKAIRLPQNPQMKGAIAIE